MPRGRLIFPFVVELAQLDTSATAADPDGAGPLEAGYDELFREPVKVPGAGQAGTTNRVETLVQFRAQIEPDQEERLEAMLSGESPNSRFAVVAHYRDLERAGLVDATTGRPRIRKRDRLNRILTVRGVLVETIPDPPGLYVTEVQSRGFGLGTRRNLLLVVFEDRETSLRSAGG
jgi:hypothetical protein